MSNEVSLSDLLSQDKKVLDLQGTTAERIIEELINELAAEKGLDDIALATIKQSVIAREQEASTGIGNGLAVPHMKGCQFVSKITGVFGRSLQGVDFSSVDGAPAKVFFLILTPQEHNSEHIRLMRRLSLMSQDKKTMQYLGENEQLTHLKEIFEEIDSKVD